jgi:hypothetical protein
MRWSSIWPGRHVRPYGEVTLDLDNRLTIGTGVRAGFSVAWPGGDWHQLKC